MIVMVLNTSLQSRNSHQVIFKKEWNIWFSQKGLFSFRNMMSKRMRIKIWLYWHFDMESDGEMKNKFKRRFLALELSQSSKNIFLMYF